MSEIKVGDKLVIRERVEKFKLFGRTEYKYINTELTVQGVIGDVIVTLEDTMSPNFISRRSWNKLLDNPNVWELK